MKGKDIRGKQYMLNESEFEEKKRGKVASLQY